MKQLTSQVIGDLSDSRPPSISVSKQHELKPSPRSLVQNNVAVGYSGGRDSSMSIEILKECDFAVYPYTISYDSFDPTKRFSTTQSSEFPDPYYESFDIPVTYFAPLWDTHDRLLNLFLLVIHLTYLGLNLHRGVHLMNHLIP